jgi:hypothetical protein
VLTLTFVSQVATTPASLAFVHKLAAMVRTARLESCGALGVSSDVPIGVPAIIGRHGAIKTMGFKLELGIVHADDGISRSQAQLQVGRDGRASLQVSGTALNPVRVIREAGGSQFLDAGKALQLQAGDVLELDTYRKPCQCRFMVQTACTTALGRV